MAGELKTFPDEFVHNIQGHPYHSKWVAANKAEAAKWAKFRDDVIAGKQVTPPTMSSKYGKALVAAGKEHMSISHMVGTVVDPYPPVPSAPPSSSSNLLTWSPPGYPTYAGYVTVDIPNTGPAPAPYGTAGQYWVVSLAANTDYILEIDRRAIAPGGYCGLAISGGRNVVIIGGEIFVDNDATHDYSKREVLKFYNQTGIVHVEGVLITGDGIHGRPFRSIVNASGSIIYQVQNCRFEKTLMWEENQSEPHSDVWLDYSGISAREVRMDMNTFEFDNTAMAHYYTYNGILNYKRTNLRSIGIRSDGSSIPGGLGGQYFNRQMNTRIYLDQMYCETGWGRDSSTAWPGPGSYHQSLSLGFRLDTGASGPGAGTITEVGDGISAGSYIEFPNPAADNIYPGGAGTYARVYYGTPPGGDYCPAGVAGSGYVSPGYA